MVFYDIIFLFVFRRILSSRSVLVNFFLSLTQLLLLLPLLLLDIVFVVVTFQELLILLLLLILIVFEQNLQ